MVSGKAEEMVSGGVCPCAGGGENDENMSKIIEFHVQQGMEVQRKFVVKLGEAVSKLMNVKIDLNQSNDRIVKEIQAQLPNLKNSEILSNDKSTQKEACKLLAEALNDVFGTKVINTNQSEAKICQDCNEILNAYASGLHQNFMIIAATVQTAINNIIKLKTILKSMHNKILSSIEKKGNEELKIEVSNMADVFNELDAELERQLLIIQGSLMGSVKEQEPGIMAIVNDREFVEKYLNRIDISSAEPGSKQLSRLITGTLTNMSNTELLAQRIQVAMQKANVTLEQLKNFSPQTIDKLKSDLMEKFAKQSHEDVTNDLYKLTNLFELLDSGRSKYGEIIKLLESSSGRIEGSDETKLGKLIREKKSVNEVMMRQFDKRFSELLENLYINLSRFVEKISSGEVKISQDLEEFALSIGNLSEIHDKDVKDSLSGQFNSIGARLNRERVINNIKAFIVAAKNLESKQPNEYLSKIVSSAEEIIKFSNDNVNVYSLTTANFPTRIAGSEESAILKRIMTFGKISEAIKKAYKVAKMKK